MRVLSLLFLAACGSSHAESPAGAQSQPAEPQAEAPWQHFGEAFTVASSVPAASVLGDPAPHAEGPVRLTGELSEVCQKMGCWAVVRDGAGQSIRITMKDHAFGIAKDARGKACDVEGQLVKKDVDPAKLAHYESEGGTHNPEAGKAEAWELVASSVAISGS